MSLYVCNGCSHVAFNSAPQQCPACSQESFTQNDSVFTESMEKSKEGAVKHVPSVTVNKSCGLIPEQPCQDVLVRIGSTLHPMEAAHFIQFADCYVDGQFVSRMQFTPGGYAAGAFHLKKAGQKVSIVEKCNLHGHWMSEVSL